LRIRPARIISWWLGISASAGTSFTVGIKALLNLIILSLLFSRRLRGDETPLYILKTAVLQEELWQLYLLKTF